MQFIPPFLEQEHTLLENGVNIRFLQKLMGHTDVKTTEIYTHVMEKGIPVVRSTLDRLE